MPLSIPSLLQGDHGGLTLCFVDFDLVCSSVYQTLLMQVKIGQKWHGKYANWQKFQIEVNNILSQTTLYNEFPQVLYCGTLLALSSPVPTNLHCSIGSTLTLEAVEDRE